MSPPKHHFRYLMLNLSFDISWAILHLCKVRTTLTLDDDVFKAVARLAKARGVSLGKAVSDLARRTLNAPAPSTSKDGLVIFDLPPDSPPVNSEDVRRLEAEGA